MSLTVSSKNPPPDGYSATLAEVMAITKAGLVLGTTVLASVRSDASGKPEIAIVGAEERILALLAVAYGGIVTSAVLDNIRRAVQYWRVGESSLAAIELALSGLPPLRDVGAFSRLLLGEQLLSDGVTTRELLNACGLDPASLDLKAGYHPDQPRVPAGSPDGGQWTSGDIASEGTSSDSSAEPETQASNATRTEPNDGAAGFGASTPQDQPSSAAGTELADYKVITEPPKDAKVVVPPNGVPIRGGDSPILLIAPPHSDYRKVYAAGRAIAPLSPLDQILHIRAAPTAGRGAYDFQRDPIRQEIQPAYANASNYAGRRLSGRRRILALGSAQNG
jgi:hypothetical protein